MIGHTIGTIVEIPTRYICHQFITSNEAICSTAAIVLHEAVIEPAVNALTYNSIGRALYNSEDCIENFFNEEYWVEYWQNFNTPKTLYILAGSLTASYSYQLFFAENIMAEATIGTIGSYVSEYIYDQL